MDNLETLTTLETQDAGRKTKYKSLTTNDITVFSGVHVARSLDLCVLDCRSLFVRLSFSFWTLYCLSFFGVAFNND
jgi:hypothetical protein